MKVCQNKSMIIKGRCLSSGLPKSIEICSEEILEPLNECATAIIEVLHNVLENTPPELSSDIYDNGIMLAGGGALLAGLDTLVSRFTGIRTMVAKAPLDCVAVGIGRVIDSMGELGGIVTFRSR